jgi:HTH-type transcriptional regulator / antitoxin HigA
MSALTNPVESQREYAKLLSKSLPSVIHSEKQHDAMLRQLEGLLSREEKLSRAEKELVSLLTLLIEDFEDRNYELPRTDPVEILKFLMDQHGLRQKDLADIFGTPSIVSEVLNGKRQLNKDHIQKLSQRFHISPEVFFELT